MLSKISITNFYSLRDPAIIDMKVGNNRAYRNEKTRSNIFQDGDETLLKSIAIFGANASGKSNLLKSIDVCMGYIIDSYHYTGSIKPAAEPFKFNDETVPSSFEMTLTIDEEKYEYGFSILSNQIVEEHLYSYPKKYRALVFRRSLKENGGYEYSFSKKFGRPKEVVANTSPYTLFLTRAALMNRPEALKVYNFVENNVIVGLPRFEDSEFEELLQTNKDLVLQALRYADSDIVDYEFKVVNEEEGSAKHRLLTYHKGNPSIPFNFYAEESAGTQRLMRLLAAYIYVADNGRILIVDELEKSLHPHLLTYAVKLFNQSTNAQLIFSTHDLHLMDIGVLRPDQIYFASKDIASGATDIYSLSDFSDYKGYKNLLRDYEQGRFDAVPILPSF